MPAISPEGAPLVLVSGANGYIAMHVIQALLQRGYRVRGTVRSESKIPHIRTTFAAFSDKLEIVVVEDITVDGAFEQVLLGVDAVAHLAAHVSFEPDDPQGQWKSVVLICDQMMTGVTELIVPAVNGTVGVMKDAMKKG
jgi:nucleoside-diphosphate-sugar epimerase